MELSHLNPSYADLSWHFTQISGCSHEFCCQETHRHSGSEDGLLYSSSVLPHKKLVHGLCWHPYNSHFCILALTKIKSDFNLSSPSHLKADRILLFLSLVCFLPLTPSPILMMACVHLQVAEAQVYLCATSFTAFNPLSSTFTDCCLGPSAMALSVFWLSVMLDVLIWNKIGMLNSTKQCPPVYWARQSVLEG